MTLDGDDGVPAGDDDDVDIMGNSSDVGIIDLDDYHSAGSITTCMSGLSCRCELPCKFNLKWSAFGTCNALQTIRSRLQSCCVKHPCILVRQAPVQLVSLSMQSTFIVLLPVAKCT